MATLDQLAERHSKEMGDVLSNQVHSRKALREHYRETLLINDVDYLYHHIKGAMKNLPHPSQVLYGLYLKPLEISMMDAA